MGGGIVPIIVRRRERQLRNAFLSAGATQPTSAATLDQLGVSQSMSFRRLCRHEVIRQPSPDLFYFDEDSWRELTSFRRRMLLLVLGSVLLVLLAGLWLMGSIGTG